jgi:hypothetical protein
MKLESFDEVRKAIQSNRTRRFHLLLGNGFSMSYDPGIFSYNALHGFIETLDDALLSKLFGIINTKNFELVMHQLENFIELARAFDTDPKFQSQLDAARTKLKTSMVDAIGALHPEHVFTIPQVKLDSCAAFLKLFQDTRGSIYTTNYDLLLYWVLMRSKSLSSTDGFGRDLENPEELANGEDPDFSAELRWGKHKAEQDIFYLHGALPLFDTGIDIVKEQYDTKHYLIQKVTNRIDQGDYPVFVTAGNGHEKLTHIRHNRYLEHAYESLANIDGSLVSFGFNFGEYDDHIIDAINRAAKPRSKTPPKLWSIYIGAYSEGDQRHIERIASRVACKVHIFDSKTVDVWNAGADVSPG